MDNSRYDSGKLYVSWYVNFYIVVLLYIDQEITNWIRKDLRIL